MNTQSYTTSNSRADSEAIHSATSPSGDRTATAAVSDRLYQIAALTAGIFLLATLL